MSQINFGDLFVRVYTLMVGLAFGLGTVTISGGAARFSSPSFDGPKNLVSWLPFLPEHTYWGLIFLAYGCGLVVSMGRQYAVHILRLGIVVFLFLAVGMSASLIGAPKAALTGVVTYTAIASLFLLLSDHLRVHGWGG